MRKRSRTSSSGNKNRELGTCPAISSVAGSFVHGIRSGVFDLTNKFDKARVGDDFGLPTEIAL